MTVCMEQREGAGFVAIGLAFIGAGLAGVPALAWGGVVFLAVAAVRHLRAGRVRP